MTITGVGLRDMRMRKNAEAVELGHLQVERDHVGSQLKHQVQPLLPVGGTADDCNFAARLQHGADGLAVEGRVVDDDHPYRPVAHGFRYTISFFRCTSSKAVVTLISDSEWTEQKIPTVTQLAVQRVDHLPSGIVIEIDEHVAAEDDVHLADDGGGRFIEQVDLAEADQLADLVAHLVPAIDLAKIAAQDARLGGAKGAAAVGAFSCNIQDPAGDVAAEDAHVPVAEHAGLEQQDGDGIRLFSRRAAGRPDGQAPPVGR